MSINTASPSLSYVSSQDVSSAPSGTTSYTILFDATNASYGNLIMFEYKLQDINTTPDLDNTEFGFVAAENAVQTGLSNQYIITVPASETTNDGGSTQTIQVRIYFGYNSSPELVVTDWSNQLNLQLPPTTPVIFTSAEPGFDGSFFDNTEGKLYVLLKEPDNQIDYDYDVIRFIVCFFYQVSNEETVWKVSDPTQATETTIGNETFRLITVNLQGSVLEGSNAYVSMHSVYNWTYEEKIYHSVSFMSNEVVSIPSTNDSDPNITSVKYNIYDEVAIPGDQTMLVTWEPPGNSGLPFYAVQKYELYYKIDNDDFKLYTPIGIDPNTLEYIVNVGTAGYYGEGLEMKCGQSIVFRVDAVVQGENKPSPLSDPTNFFKYSEAVTNLIITNSSYEHNDQGLDMVGFTVNFTGVSDSGKGCGEGSRYVIKINGDTPTPTSGDLLDYVSGKQYAVNFSNLSINQVGTVEVYLLTRDTNTTNELAGLSETVPYIANNVTLYDVNYSIYTDRTNDSQNMTLSWTNPALTGWTVENYTVQYRDGVFWLDASDVLSTSYVFDASSVALYKRNLSFRILANMINGDGETSYVITSNEKSQNTFKFAEDVQEPIVNWSVANTDNTTMDINLQFKNPTVLGVNNGLQFFRVTVLDSDGGIVLDSAGLNSTQDISYVSSANLYTVNFNDINYSPNGTITIEPFVTDTNGRGDITSVNYEQDPGYITSTIPIFKNFNISGNTMMTCEIISHGPLKPAGSLIVRLEEIPVMDTGDFYVFDTRNDSNVQLEGITITETTGANGEYIYVLTTDISKFVSGDHLNAVYRFLYHVADDAGVGAQLAQVERIDTNDYRINFSYPPYKSFISI